MNNNPTNTDSDNIYYSPTNTDSDSEQDIINLKPEQDIINKDSLFTCYCNKNNMNCFILCFNNETNQFESINCNIFYNS